MLIPEPGPSWKHRVNGSTYRNTLNLDLGVGGALSEGATFSQPEAMGGKVEVTTCKKALRRRIRCFQANTMGGWGAGEQARAVTQATPRHVRYCVLDAERKDCRPVGATTPFSA